MLEEQRYNTESNKTIEDILIFINQRECKIRCVKWSTNFAKPYFF